MMRAHLKEIGGWGSFYGSDDGCKGLQPSYEGCQAAKRVGSNLGHRFYATEGRDSFELALTSWPIGTAMGVRSQPISGNGGHNNYGRGEKVSERKVKEIGVLCVASSCGGLGCCA
jgi:hypothetical protein